MTLDDQHWFTEICRECGSALSLAIQSRLHHEETRFQTIEVYETEKFGRLMTIDGFVMLTSRDNFLYHEMMVHPALFTHPGPRRVVIIGGGDCGTLREVLKHETVQQVVQVEIDERVTRVSERFFPELCESNDDPRAELVFADGIRWMSEAGADSVDVIIVDSTDPVGPAEGLFNAAFHAQCRRVLGTGGLFVQQSESPLFHFDLLRAMHRNMREGGFTGVHTLCFPQPTYPGGWWSATLAGAGNSVTEFREPDARRAGFETRYYTPDIHRAALAVPRFMEPLYGKRP